MSHPSSPQWRSRAMILFIALIFIVPFALAWYAARHPEGWVSGTSNYGSLIVPPRPLDPAHFVAHPAGEAANSPAELKGHWVLVQVAGSHCGPACVESLYKTHQVRLMLNKEIARVRRVLLLPREAQAGAVADILREEEELRRKDAARFNTGPEAPAAGTDEDLIVADAAADVLQTFATAVGKPLGEGVVLLMDPFANLILWYDAGFDPYKLLKDLKHLLKASQIG